MIHISFSLNSKQFEKYFYTLQKSKEFLKDASSFVRELILISPPGRMSHLYYSFIDYMTKNFLSEFYSMNTTKLYH